MSGQILGDRYEVERQLGKQTGRWTLLARDLQTQEQVVIKLLFLGDQLEFDDLKLFEREVEILKSLSHPSIPKYLGYFEHDLLSDRALALIQTYVDGKSLEQCLQQGRLFTEAEAKQIAKALLHILVYLHGRTPPILHRDIKPGNILLANRRAYLVDFGSVKALTGGGESSAFTVVGTYGYMPPEQFSGRVVPASDLYSLGATLVALIAGNHPSSLPHRGIKIDFEQIPGLSPDFATWLDWMMEPTLERRARSAQDALDSLEQGIPRATLPSPVAKPTDSKISLTKQDNRLAILIPSLWGQTDLQIDAQHIAMTSKRLGFQASRPQIAPRQSITRLEYRKPDADRQGHPGEATVPLLTIWAGSQPYELGENPPLSEAEVDWLGYELATWLNLP